MIPRADQAGFTLLELIVVIGILVLVSSIGVAAFQNSGKVNRLAAAESIVAGAIRDARMAARSTGNPSTVSIESQTLTNGDKTTYVTGVSRVAMWQLPMRDGDFTDEDGSNLEGIFQDTSNTTLQPPPVPTSPNASAPSSASWYLQEQDGLTGSCFSLKSIAAAQGFWPYAPIYSTEPGLVGKHQERKNRSRLIVRKKAGEKTEGFYLRCLVRAPSISKDTVQPLIILSSQPITAGDLPNPIGTDLVQVSPTMDGSILGLMLRPYSIIENKIFRGPPTRQSKGWDLCGWVNISGATYFISSVVDNVAIYNQSTGQRSKAEFDQSSINTFRNASNQAGSSVRDAHNYLGFLHGLLAWNSETWHEVGIMYQDDKVSLWLDGLPIAKKEGLPSELPAAAGPNVFAFLGHGAIDPSRHKVGKEITWDSTLENVVTWDDAPSQNPLPQAQVALDESARLSEVACFRLVAAQPQALPGGIELDGLTNISVSVLPDGRILSSSTNLITMKGIFDQAEDKVTLTINPTSGAVTSKIQLSADPETTSAP